MVDRHWRVRGLRRQRGGQRLRVTLGVTRGERVHLDTLDLCSARSRRAFVKEAAAEVGLEPSTVKQDLGRVLLALEAEQDALRREALERQHPTVPEMTEDQRQAARAFLSDPRLLERILEDYEACGLLGEGTNKLVCFARDPRFLAMERVLPLAQEGATLRKMPKLFPSRSLTEYCPRGRTARPCIAVARESCRVWLVVGPNRLSS
ncbi:MAG: hypothetical protein R6U98_31875 [Pirellulaceae bacterium]